MPNHVECKLDVEGLEENFKAFINNFDEEKGFFESYLPMPLEIRNTVSGTTTLEDGSFLKNYIKTDEGPIPIPEDFIERFGAPTWYEWAIMNWGTKWGDYDLKTEIQHEWGYATFYFNTAWSAPIRGLETISKEYPTLEFKIRYIDEGDGFMGVSKVKNGQTTVIRGDAGA